MNEKKIRQPIKWYDEKRIIENYQKQLIKLSVPEAVRIGRETICIRITREEYEKLREK